MRARFPASERSLGERARCRLVAALDQPLHGERQGLRRPVATEPAGGQDRCILRSAEDQEQFDERVTRGDPALVRNLGPRAQEAFSVLALSPSGEQIEQPLGGVRVELGGIGSRQQIELLLLASSGAQMACESREPIWGGGERLGAGRLVGRRGRIAQIGREAGERVMRKDRLPRRCDQFSVGGAGRIEVAAFGQKLRTARLQRRRSVSRRVYPVELCQGGHGRQSAQRELAAFRIGGGHEQHRR